VRRVGHAIAVPARIIAVPDLGARERMLPQTDRMYACNRSVHPMNRNFVPLRREGFRGIFGETQTRSEKTVDAG
jgi:hypothetical protein